MAKANILIVDDEPRVLEGLKMNLGREYEVFTTTEADQALRWLKKTRFAVIISDLKMPRISGVELLNQAREISPFTVRVLLTGFASLNAALDAINLGGVFKLLTKPSSPPEVREVVAQAVEAHQSAMDQERVEKHLDLARRAQEFEAIALGMSKELSGMALQFSAVLYAAADGQLSQDDIEDLRWVEDRLHATVDRLAKVEGPALSKVKAESVVGQQTELWERSGRLGSIGLSYKSDFSGALSIPTSVVEQGINCFLENAVNALQGADSPRIKVRLYFCHFMEMACLEVKNNGPAMPSYVTNKLLESPVKSGTGSGESLYLLNKVLGQFGGKVGFRQRSNGVSFMMWMPLHASENSSAYMVTEQF